ncbi:MAG: DUF3754 domain-containing protein [Phycisphaerae bacterium]|jgi:hypothetical protein
MAANAVLARDPTAGIDHHRPDDRFIPFRFTGLVARLRADDACFGPDAALLVPLASAIESICEQQAAAFERLLAERYEPFNPDRDTIPLIDVAAARDPEHHAALQDRLDYLLAKANFEPLTNTQVEQALQAARSSGLRVRLDPEQVAYLRVWVRGAAVVDRVRRTWRHPRFGVRQSCPVFRRLVVVSRLHDDPGLRIKMFKEIPVADVESLLPHARVAMTWMDRARMMGGGAGTLGSTVMKITGALALPGKLLWILAGGFAMLMFKTFTGYRNVRRHRDLQRTTHLYYQNLGNNAGAVHLLLSMVAQEEAKEAFLAYAFLLHATPPIRSAAELRQRVESYCAERLGVHFLFDVADALESVDRLQLWSDREAWQVLPAAEAVRRLREHWQQRLSADYHEQMVLRSPAPNPMP